MVRVFSFLLIALLIHSGAHAQSYLENMNRPASIKFGAESSFDLRADDGQGFDNLGDRIRVRDLRLQTDVIWKIFGARLLLEENSNDLGIDAKNLEESIKDLYVGINPNQNLVVIFGKTTIPFGRDYTQRAIDRNNPIHAKTEELERYVLASVKVSPQVIGKFVSSIEVAGINSESTKDKVKLSEIKDMDSYSVRVNLAPIRDVMTQVSYLDMKTGETRMSVSGEGFVTFWKQTFLVYGEAQRIKNNPFDGDSNLATLGASTTIGQSGKTKAFAEMTRRKVRNQKSQNYLTVGATRALNAYVDVGSEAVVNTSKLKDNELWVTLRVHNKTQF